MKDFTLEKYKIFLSALRAKNSTTLRVDQFFQSQPTTFVIIRNDVDKLPENSLRIAKLQAGLSISSTFYFRIKGIRFDEEIISEIAGLGHEIGYHYETLDTCHGDPDKAYDEFCRNLDKLRKIYPVQTVCMHGSPLSKFDNRVIWEKYNYKSLGIIAEPYLDLDFNNVFYITDTGRKWDGARVSIRDKTISNTAWPKYHSTSDIIQAIEQGSFPDKALMTFHPQRWHDNTFQWYSEIITQNVKNLVKFGVIKVRNGQTHR
jgi:hypothetical protein